MVSIRNYSTPTLVVTSTSSASTASGASMASGASCSSGMTVTGTSSVATKSSSTYTATAPQTQNANGSTVAQLQAAYDAAFEASYKAGQLYTAVTQTLEKFSSLKTTVEQWKSLINNARTNEQKQAYQKYLDKAEKNLADFKANNYSIISQYDGNPQKVQRLYDDWTAKQATTRAAYEALNQGKAQESSASNASNASGASGLDQWGQTQTSGYIPTQTTAANIPTSTMFTPTGTP